MVIRKQGSKYILYNHGKTKKLGTFRSKKAAVERERQIQYFKRIKGSR